MNINVCPFCGNSAQLITVDTAEYYIECNYCNARGPKSDFENEAIESWNNILIDIYIRDIYVDDKRDELGVSNSVAIFNKRIHNSYIQIYYNDDSKQFEFMLLYRPKFSRTYVAGKSYIKYCNSLTEAFDIFNKCYNKLFVNSELHKIVHELKLEEFKNDKL